MHADDDALDTLLHHSSFIWQVPIGCRHAFSVMLHTARSIEYGYTLKSRIESLVTHNVVQLILHRILASCQERDLFHRGSWNSLKLRGSLDKLSASCSAFSGSRCGLLCASEIIPPMYAECELRPISSADCTFAVLSEAFRLDSALYTIRSESYTAGNFSI